MIPEDILKGHVSDEMSKTIGEMSEKEILQLLQEAKPGDLVYQFIMLWIDLNDPKQFKEKYPEYFL